MSSGQDTRKKPSVRHAKVKPEPKQADMGSALRTVYQKAVDEAVPDDLLDLLGKLN